MFKNIYTLCRSGNHAIIFWIINNFGGYDQETAIENVLYTSKNNHICFVNNFNHKVHNSPINIPESYINTIVSFEDHYVTQISDTDLIIIRDFYNTLASRYKLWKPYLGIKDQQYIHTIDDFILYWKNLANHALYSNKYIYYNSWLFDQNYRNTVMNKFFDYNNDIDNTIFVPGVGVGSSYAGKKLESDKTKYLSRYHETDMPEEWKQRILSDTEIDNLCLSLGESIYE